MSLADAVLSALNGYKDEVLTWVNQGHLTSVEQHIAQVKNAVETDLQAGETAAKEVLAELYSAFHGSNVAANPEVPAAQVPPTEPVSSPAQDTSSASSTTSAPSEAAPAAPSVVESNAAPLVADGAGPVVALPADSGAHVDPTPAPSTTTEASSAPSSTPSASTTDAPAAEAAPETLQA